VDRRLADEVLRSMPGMRLSNFDDPDRLQSGRRSELPEVELDDMEGYELYPDPTTDPSEPDLNLKCLLCNFEANNMEHLDFHQVSRTQAPITTSREPVVL